VGRRARSGPESVGGVCDAEIGRLAGGTNRSRLGRCRPRRAVGAGSGVWTLEGISLPAPGLGLHRLSTPVVGQSTGEELHGATRHGDTSPCGLPSRWPQGV